MRIYSLLRVLFALTSANEKGRDGEYTGSGWTKCNKGRELSHVPNPLVVFLFHDLKSFSKQPMVGLFDQRGPRAETIPHPLALADSVAHRKLHVPLRLWKCEGAPWFWLALLWTHAEIAFMHSAARASMALQLFPGFGRLP